MRRQTFVIGNDPAEVPGAVLCRDVSVDGAGGATTVRRGTNLDEAIGRLAADGRTLKLEIVVPSAAEIPQAEASRRLANAIAGPGVVAEAPHQGQVTLKAAHAGLLRVRGPEVARLNRGRAALVATALDGRVVAESDGIGIVKAPELFVDRAAVERAIAQVAAEPVLRVAPFRVHHVGLIAGERIRQVNLDHSTPHLAATLQPFGAELSAVKAVKDDPAEIAAAIRDQIEQGVETMLVAGSIVLDPSDPFLRALRRIGAKLVRRAAPIEPGTMFWVAYTGTVPIFGLASCEMYGRLSILDLLLPYALAGEPVTYDLLAELGYGGLLHTTQSARRS